MARLSPVGVRAGHAWVGREALRKIALRGFERARGHHIGLATAAQGKPWRRLSRGPTAGLQFVPCCRRAKSPEERRPSRARGLVALGDVLHGRRRRAGRSAESWWSVEKARTHVPALARVLGAEGSLSARRESATGP